MNLNDQISWNSNIDSKNHNQEYNSKKTEISNDITIENKLNSLKHTDSILSISQNPSKG